MAYTPNNVNIFLAAMAGAVAGMSASTRASVGSSDPANPANVNVANVALAFAEAYDTVWGINVGVGADSLQIDSTKEICEAFWEARQQPNATTQFLNPTVYLAQCRNLIAYVQAGETAVIDAGVTPPGPPLPGNALPFITYQPVTGVDVSAALTTASTAIGAQNGGLVWALATGKPNLDAPVNLTPTNTSDFEWRGQGSAGVMSVTDASGINVKILCSGDNGFRASYRDLSFVSGVAVGSDCEAVFQTGIAASHEWRHCNFYGIQADVTGLGVVAAFAGRIVIEDSLFSGCAVVPGVGALANVGIVQVRGGVFGAEIRRSRWVSANSLNGVAPPFKAQGAGCWAILITGDQSDSRAVRCTIDNCEFGWNMGGSVRADPDSGFNVAALSYIDDLAIIDSQFADNAAIGGVVIYVRKTRALSVEGSIFRMNGGANNIAVQADDIVQTMHVHRSNVLFGWQVVAHSSAFTTGWTGYQTLRVTETQGGVYVFDNAKYVEMKSVTPGASIDPLFPEAGATQFLDQPAIPLGTSINLGSGIAQADLIGIISPLAGPGFNVSGHPDNAASNYWITLASNTKLEDCQAALVDLQGPRASALTNGLKTQVSVDSTGGIERRQVVTEVDVSLRAVAGGGGTADVQFVIDPSAEVSLDLEVQATDGAFVPSNAGIRVRARAALGTPGTAGSGAQSRLLTAAAGNNNPAPAYDLNQTDDTAFGTTAATVVVLGGTNTNKVALRVTNQNASAEDFRVKGTITRTWESFDPSTWAPNYQGLLASGAGIVIEFADDTSIPNVGAGNPVASWPGRTQRIDMAQAAGAQKPIYNAALSPAALPGLIFNPGAPAQNMSVDLSVALGQPGFSLINGTLWIVCAINAGGQAMISLSDGVSTPHACALQVFGGHWALLRDQALPGALSSQVDDTNYHVIIGTFYQGRAQIYVDGITGTPDATAWTPAVQLKVVTLADFVPGGAGGGASGIFDVSAFGILNNALPDPGVGTGVAVPAGSLVGKLYNRLKARYGTP